MEINPKIERISYMVTTILINIEENDIETLDHFLKSLTEKDLKMLKIFADALIELHDGLKPYFDKYYVKTCKHEKVIRKVCRKR